MLPTISIHPTYHQSMRTSGLFLLFVTIFAFTGCGGSDPDTVETGEPETGSSDSSEPSDDKRGGIMESGFGQPKGMNSQYVWVTALVKNLSDHGGQTVTVSFNLMDESGGVIATTEQVESFNIEDQELAVGTQVDVGSRVQVASVEPTLLVEDDGTFEETDVDLGHSVADSIKVDQYSNDTWHAKFTIENPTDEPLQDPRIGIICHGADGKVNGGGSEYPELVPPSGQIVLDPYLTVSGKPKDCTAYVASGAF